MLAWGDRPPLAGMAEGVCSPSGELRCAAEACLAALAEGVPKRRFDLVGVKALRAFDSTLVVASLAERGGSGGPRLVGSVLAKRNHVPAAVKAVLHAVNRVITSDLNSNGRNGNEASGI